MPRPKKETVDYFPHFCNSGKTLYILEQTFCNDGYAFWFKVLELLGHSDGHYYDCRNTPAWKFLLAKTYVNEDKAIGILNLLVELDAIDKELWDNKIIWSDNFVKNLMPVYSNRKSDLPKRPVIDSKNVNVDEFLPVEIHDSLIATDENPQTIVKETIVKETKEEKPPPAPHEEIKKLYNEICKSLTPIKSLSKNRMEKIRTRWKQLDFNIDNFKKVFETVENSSFCKGSNDRGWKADFDWIVKNDENIIKILEGKYDNKKMEGVKVNGVFNSNTNRATGATEIYDYDKFFI